MSPLLALTIILAITVGVGMGISSFVFGLFGSYTEAAALGVSGKSTLNNPSTTFNVTLLNSGTHSDSVLSVETIISGTRYSATIDSATVIVGGGGTLNLDSTFTGSTFTPGTAYQIKIAFNSGNHIYVATRSS
jgi:hypothetical protein